MKYRMSIIASLAIFVFSYVYADTAQTTSNSLALAHKFSPILILTEATSREFGNLRVTKPEPISIMSAQYADSIRFEVRNIYKVKKGVSNWRSLFFNRRINVDDVDFSQNHFAFLPSLFTQANPSGYIPGIYLIRPYFDYPGTTPAVWDSIYFGSGPYAGGPHVGENFSNTAYVHI